MESLPDHARRLQGAPEHRPNGLYAGSREPGEDAERDDSPADAPPVDPLPAALHSGGRLFDVVLPVIEYACRPYAPRREVIEVGGPHSRHKSTVMLNLALAIATGRPWGGVPVVKGRSTFITLEDTEAVLQVRVLAYLAGIEDEEERRQAEADIRASFTYLGREDARPLVLTVSDGPRTVACRPAVVDRIISLAEGRALISLETSARLHPGPEDHVGLSALAEAGERIATTTGAATLIGRHNTKAASREGNADSFSTSGAAVFSNCARSILSIDQDGRRKPKPNEEPEPPDPFALVRLRQVKPPPLAPPGRELVWRPTEVDTWLGRHIYLATVSEGDQLREAGYALLRHLNNVGEITKTDLHKNPPCSLGRALASRAMEHLKDQGKVRLIQVEGRGKTKQPAWVWVVA